MRILSKWAVAGGLFTLGTLAGCGGGSNSSSVTPAPTTGTRSDSPVAPIRVAYTVTDLGATEYYYSYFGYITNRYRYSGVLRINDAGQIITNTYSNPVLYNGQPIPLKGASYGSVYGLNNAGVAVGNSYTNDVGYVATRWISSGGSPLDAAPDRKWSTAFAVNDSGAIVGQSSQGRGWYDSPTMATLWQDGTKTSLGSLGGNFSLAYNINNSGVVVGWSQLTGSTSNSYYDNSPIHAFVWNSGTMTDLGLLPGGDSSDAQDINDSGQIVGSADVAAQGIYSYRALHAVTWTGGTISDLGTLGGPGSIGYALNNSGVIVGSGDTSTLAPQSTYYGWYYGYGSGGTGNGAGGGTGGGGSSPGGGTGGNAGGGSGSGNNTPPLAGGAGGRSVKSAQGTRSSHSPTSRGIGDTYVSHAFRFVNGKMEDLNAFIDPDNGWELLTATDINASGQIVGYGKYGNKQHAFLLTPAP